MTSVDLDAPEHALCSETLAARDRQLRAMQKLFDGSRHHNGVLVGERDKLRAENERLRAELTRIAERYCESDVGFIAERALMNDEQRAATDAAGIGASLALDDR